MEEEVAPFGGDDARNGERDDEGLEQVCRTDPENVAEQDVVEVNVALDLDIKDESEAEHPGKDHAENRVLLDPAVVLEEAGGNRRKHAGDEGPDRIGDVDDVGDHYP